MFTIPVSREFGQEYTFSITRTCDNLCICSAYYAKKGSDYYSPIPFFIK